MIRELRIGIIFILGGCTYDTSFVQGSNYFDLDSLISHQVVQLAERNPVVTKTVRIDGEDEKQQIRFDSVEWGKELKIVLDLDVNLPRYVGALDIVRTNNTLTYSPKETEDLPIGFVAYTFSDTGDLVGVRGSFIDDKARSIYNVSRIIELSFQDGLLSKYRVYGFQKMAMRDTTEFEVLGELSY